MSPESIPPGSPKDWMLCAKGDLRIARYPLPKEGLYGVLCFHAQQTVEKSIKAVLIYEGIPFPKVHRIKTLLDLLPGNVLKIPEMEIADRLTAYAVISRYPGVIEEVTEELYMEAMNIAEAFYLWAQSIITEAKK